LVIFIVESLLFIIQVVQQFLLHLLLLSDFDQSISVLSLGDFQLLESFVVLLLLNLNLIKGSHVGIMLYSKFLLGGLLFGNNLLVLLLSELLLSLLLLELALDDLLLLSFSLELELSSLLDQELWLSLRLQLRFNCSFLLLDWILLGFQELLCKFLSLQVLLGGHSLVLFSDNFEFSFGLLGLLELELVLSSLLLENFLINLTSSLLFDHSNGVSFFAFPSQRFMRQSFPLLSVQ
jgi:hypothetical protein